MNSSSITPAPWIAQGSTIYAGDKVVAARVNNLANARAIAALPQMVSALLFAKTALEGLPDSEIEPTSEAYLAVQNALGAAGF